MGTAENVVKCSQCGHVVGKIIQIDDKEFLDVNGMTVTVMRAACQKCGEEFHWSISERLLSELLKRVLELRQNQV
jgi:predicted Zn-ribbon and HTH transcriptional regulator